MNEIFFISKNTSLGNYLFVLLEEIYPNMLTMGSQLSSKTKLVCVDSETVMPEELGLYTIEAPIILFAYEMKPLLLQYTSKFDVNGVICMDMEASDIRQTLETALQSDIYYNENMIGLLFSNKTNSIAERVRSLTEREEEILILMLNDLTNEEIAQKLNLSVRTVNAHKGNIMRKIDAKTTSGLIRILMEYSATLKKQL